MGIVCIQTGDPEHFHTPSVDVIKHVLDVRRLVPVRECVVVDVPYICKFSHMIWVRVIPEAGKLAIAAATHRPR